MNSLDHSSVPPLKVESVVKCFHQGKTAIAALDGINLTVETGELVAIMGASGSGKSTLLHAMTGLTDIDAGTVSVDGQDLAALSDYQLTKFRGLNIGLVFQVFNLIPSLSAEDNIRLPATEEPGLEERMGALLERLDMTDRRTHKPDALSGGEQQRIAMWADRVVVLKDGKNLAEFAPSSKFDPQEIASQYQGVLNAAAGVMA